MSDAQFREQFDLYGRVAVITGGAGLLGRALSAAYAEFGADVAILDIDGEQASSHAAELVRRFGRRCLGIPCDIADKESVVQASRAVAETLGPIRILHNNAANQSIGLKDQFAPFESYDLEDWRRVMNVDVTGAFLVVQTFGTGMARHGLGGSIIQTSSIYGHLAPDNRIYEGTAVDGRRICSPAVYSAAKAAAVSLTRWVATYWADAGIRANVIVPGGVEHQQSDSFKQAYSARVPLGRMAGRDDVVGAALFLASDASSYVTGQCLFVDGGLSAW